MVLFECNEFAIATVSILWQLLVLDLRLVYIYVSVFTVFYNVSNILCKKLNEECPAACCLIQLCIFVLNDSYQMLNKIVQHNIMSGDQECNTKKVRLALKIEEWLSVIGCCGITIKSICP